MLKQLKTSHFNADDQNSDNSSQSDSSDNSGSQSAFDPSNAFSTNPLDWAPRAFSVDANLQSPFGWGAGFAASTAAAFGNSSSQSMSAASGSSPSGSVPSGSAASGPSLGGSSQIVSMSGSGLVFNNTYDASCSAAYIACIVSAEDELESLFTNSVTINESFSEANQGNTGGALGNSFSYWNESYSTLKAALPSGDVLPSTDPSGGANWAVPVAYARMLGLSGYTGSPDDAVTLNTYYGWSYGQDVINGVIHEISEGGMGRIGGLGGSGGGGWAPMDLFRYNASDVPDYTNGRDGDVTYFDDAYNGNSLSDANLPNKGAPTLSYHNQYDPSDNFHSGDNDDWSQEAVFGTVGGGETLGLTQTELDVMRSLGWTLSLKQDVDGTAATGNSWETPTDWSTGSMPIEAQDAYITGAGVTLNSNVIVNSIGTSSGGILEIGDSSATSVVAVEGTTLNSLTTSYTGTGNNGDTLVYDGSSLQIGYFDVTYTNAGTLGIGDKGAGGTGYLYLASEVEFNGGGYVVLGAGSGYYGDILNASGVNGDLVNDNNTFEGNGLISLADITNSGVIKATTGTLTVSATSGIDDTNGWLEATSGGLLQLESVVSGSGGYVYAGSGGTVDIWSSVGAGIDAYVAYGGVENVELGGSTNYGTVYGTAYTSAGAFNSSTSIESGGAQYVYGSSYYATIATYGNQYIESGGYAYGTNDGWNQFVYTGGETVFTSALTADGDEYVSGGSAYYTVLSNGGGQYIYSGGLGYEALIYSGGFQYVYAGGTDDYTQVYAGGVEYNYGSAYGDSIYGTGYTEAGGVNSSTYVGSTGFQYVYGSSVSATIAIDGNQYVESGGYAYGTNDGWNQFVYAGGVTYYTSALTADGDQYVSGGTAYYTVLSGGGGQYVYSGGLGYEAFVESGGFQEVLLGGTADYTYVYAGGSQYNYGSSYGASIYGTGYTYAGGINSSTTVESGGAQYVYGSSVSATIATYGNQYVESGGVTWYTNDGWNQFVYGGGVTYYTSALTGAGDQYVSGGTAYYTLLSGGGGQYVYSGGLGYEAFIHSGGFQDILSGGTADYSQVSSGGVEYDYGLAYAGAVSSGGNEYVELGGVDSSTTILKAGKQTVYAGGSAYYDAVSSGGTQYDSGFAFSTTIVKGGIQNVLSGGYEDYSNVYGVENVSSGGGAYYDTVESGATEQVHGFAYDVSILLGRRSEHLRGRLRGLQPGPWRRAHLRGGLRLRRDGLCRRQALRLRRRQLLDHPERRTGIRPFRRRGHLRVRLVGRPVVRLLRQHRQLGDRC